MAFSTTYGRSVSSVTNDNTMAGVTRSFICPGLSSSVNVDAYVLDFACREMADADLLRKLPDDKRVHVGVIDVRTLEIEHPEQVADRIRKTLAHIDAERVTLTTDCGLKQLPRTVALEKLRALVDGAAIVRETL